MNRTAALCLALAGFGLPAGAASLTVGGLVDADGGTAVDVDGRISPSADWSVGAGVGHSSSKFEGTDFSGTSLRASTDAGFGPVLVAGSVERWRDSNQLRSIVAQAEIGWISESGFVITALFADRSLDLEYSITVLGQSREQQIDFDGTGFGADLSWLGASWSLGARFIDYSYGRSVDRVRAALDSPNIERFPRLQLLVDSVVTRAVGAPDREIGIDIARRFGRSSLRGGWLLLRDALTGDDVNSVALTLGRDLNPHLAVDVTAGFSDGAAAGTLAYGGLALRLSASP